MDCKACGESLLHSKGHRVLQGQPYTALFDIASSTGKVAAEEVHKALASGQSYTCKQCHSTLVKYASISAHIRTIQSHLSTKLSTEPSVVSCSHLILGKVIL